jgi:hypothetical protein
MEEHIKFKQIALLLIALVEKHILKYPASIINTVEYKDESKSLLPSSVSQVLQILQLVIHMGPVTACPKDRQKVPLHIYPDYMASQSCV